MKRKIFLFLSILLFGSHLSFGDIITLQWDPNTEPDLAGYKLYYKTGIISGPPYDGTGISILWVTCDSPVDLGDITEVTIDVPVGKNYIFTVTAYDNEIPSLESDYSNEVEYDASEVVYKFDSDFGSNSHFCFLNSIIRSI